MSGNCMDICGSQEMVSVRNKWNMRPGFDLDVWREIKMKNKIKFIVWLWCENNIGGLRPCSIAAPILIINE